MGAPAQVLRVVFDAGGDGRRPHGLSRPRPRGGSALHHQDHGGAAKMAGRHGRGHHRPSDGTHREGVEADRCARQHALLYDARSDHDPGHAERHDQAQGCAAAILSDPQTCAGYSIYAALRCAAAELQRRVWRRLRQYLRLHGRRPDAAPVARLCGASPLRNPQRAEHRQGAGDRRGRRGDLSRFHHSEDREPGAQHAVPHTNTAEPEFGPALGCHPGRAGADFGAGQRAIHLGRQPAGHQPQGQRSLLPPE